MDLEPDTGMEPSGTPWKVEVTSNGSVYIRDAEKQIVAAVFGTNTKRNLANAHYICHLANVDI